MRDGAQAPSHDGLTGSFPVRAHTAGVRVTQGSGGPPMRVQLADIAKSYGAQVVLDDVSLTIGPRARIGLVGPNGVGKSTLLRIVVGVESPDRGVVVRAPQALTIGSLEQERRTVAGESVLVALARRTGVLGAELELEDAAA